MFIVQSLYLFPSESSYITQISSNNFITCGKNLIFTAISCGFWLKEDPRNPFVPLARQQLNWKSAYETEEVPFIFSSNVLALWCDWRMANCRGKNLFPLKSQSLLSGKNLKEEHGLLYVEIGQSGFEQRRQNHMGHCIISGNSRRASVVWLLKISNHFYIGDLVDSLYLGCNGLCV